ncbi:hypothetical protein [Peribacillus frigoritolerans]|uniref:hypothetical protein n=1 Tax=Peribacillus frigoritolerans TaxID=450367 RepID=UPI0010592D0F|nr:hypothetical protein [Peribacillus frigoritolerans]TDL78551.1 hypothetical protein E2R53_13860 [Peribacillus frigoritolerans]
MNIFIIMYLVGLLTGIGFYALTHFFSKEMNYKKRISIVAIIGMLAAVGSSVMSGFKGMPFILLSIGIFTIPVLIIVLGKKPLSRKFIFTIIVLFVAGAFTFSALNKTDYWIIKKTNRDAAAGDEIDAYLNEVQNNSDIRGYKIFNINEDDKAIILSLGEEMSGDNIEVLDVDEINGKTVIYVRSFYNKSPEKNPTIVIGLDRLKSEIEIRDTDGTLYEKTIK